MRWLFAAFVAQKAATLLGLFFLARYLGEFDFGRFAIALSIPTALEALTDLGLSWALIREGAGRPALARALAVATLVPKLVLAALTVAVTFFVCWSLSFPPELVEVAVLVAIAKAFDSLTYLARAVFQAHERMEFDAAAQSLDAVVRLALTLFTLIGGFGLVGLAKALVVAAAIVFAGTAAEALRHFLLPVSPAWGMVPALFWTGLPLAVVWLLESINLRSGIVVTGMSLGSVAAGNVAAAFRLIEPLVAIPAVIATVLLPLTSRYVFEERPTIPWLFRSSVKTGVLLGLVVALILLGAGPLLVGAVFGAEFDEARQIIRFLALAIVVLYVHMLLVPLVLALRQQRALIVAQLLGVTVNVAVVSLATPLGTAAAAVGLALGEVVVVAVLAFAVRQLRAFGAVAALRTAVLGVAPAAIALTAAPLGEVVATSLALILLLVLIRSLRIMEPREMSYLEGIGPGFGRVSRLLLAPIG